MKQRFSSLDVAVIAHELAATLTSLRVSNIYDLSTRIFLLKFAKPNVKEQLIIDSGFRCHLTSFTRATAAAPSPFVTKLRKCLKTRRVTDVKQVGTDRILEIVFSDGLWRLYLEFYAGGNVVLVDKEGNVTAVLRNVSEGEAHESVRVGVKYDLSMRQNINGVPDLTKERIREGLQKAVDKSGAEDGVGKKKGKKQGNELRKSLATVINEFPPILVDHAMTVQNFDSTVKPQEVLLREEKLDKLLEVLQEAQKVVAEITASDIVKGYILAKKHSKAVESGGDDQAPKVLYDDFHPFKPSQFASDPETIFLEFEGFNKTVDEFFSSIEGQKLESRLHEREAAAQQRLHEARSAHERRIGGLQQAQELNIQKAEAILANVERVQEAQDAVNGLIAQGMDWVDIGSLIENEQRRGNPVASLVKLPLKLHENTVTLLLGQAEVEKDDDSGYIGSDSESASESEDEESPQSKKQEDQRLSVDIDLSLTPWANASAYYDQKKTAAVKETKTIQSSTMALKSAERKIAADLKKGLNQEKEVLRPVRKQFWFEKFYYLISSDGYLVLGGKDAQQDELLYRRHLRKGDVYVQADLKGAATVIIKNNPSTPDAPIPPSTLVQAGTFSICASEAWDKKSVMSAYWVNADQVSKTTPQGDFLADGFIVSGKKNYLPPAQLLLGFAVAWQISGESKANHRRLRIDWVEKADPNAVSVASADDEANAEKGHVEDEEDDDDDDEDFPDAAIETKQVDSDDEDFPDAKLDRPADDDEDEDSEDESGNVAHNANPLQASTMARKTVDEEEEDDDDAADETYAPPVPVAPKRHLTAQERQALRSGRLPDAKEVDDTISDTASMTTATAKQKNALTPRGKKGKAKKAATKYADQDPEERELAMRLLGSKTGQNIKEEAAQVAREKKEEDEKAKQRRKEQHMRSQEEGKAAEAKRMAMFSGTAADDEDDEVAEQVDLEQFVPKLRAGDEVLAAIPICAPWTALASYKYKVKLQPGPLKKGKALTQIIDHWHKDGKDVKKVDKSSEDSERMWPREVELLAGMKATEVVGCLPVKGVRVMLASGSDGKGKGGGGAKGGKGKGGPQKGGKGGGKGKKK